MPAPRAACRSTSRAATYTGTTLPSGASYVSSCAAEKPWYGSWSAARLAPTVTANASHSTAPPSSSVWRRRPSGSGGARSGSSLSTGTAPNAVCRNARRLSSTPGRISSSGVRAAPANAGAT